MRGKLYLNHDDGFKLSAKGLNSGLRGRVAAGNCVATKSSRELKPRSNEPMLYYTLIFLLVAIIAGVLGFGGIAGTAATIAKVLFLVFILLFIVSLFRRKK